MSGKIVMTRASALIIRSLPDGLDTGHRLKAGEAAVCYGESLDRNWQYIVLGTASGWASAKYLEPYVAPAPSTPTVINRPSSLEGEDLELTAAIEKMRGLARAEGIEFATAAYGGVRTEADTIRILKYRDDDYAVYLRNLAASHPGEIPVPKTTWRPINPFGTSMHNYGCARDLKITAMPVSFSESEAFRRLGILAPQCGLKWGGTFHRVDTPHFELAISIEQARDRWNARS